jgi:hypothetical protein
MYLPFLDCIKSNFPLEEFKKRGIDIRWTDSD